MVVQHCYSLTGVGRDRGVCILLAMTASVAMDQFLALFVSQVPLIGNEDDDDGDADTPHRVL